MDVPAFDGASSFSLAQSERGIANIRSQVDAISADGDDRSEQLKNVAQQFEALFLGYLFKVMRSTVEPADPESSAPGKDIYVEMFDNEIASTISGARPLGLGEMIYRQLAQPKAPQSSEDSPQPISSLNNDQPSVPNEDSIRALPVAGRVSSPFGLRNDPLNGTAKFHEGLDIAAPAGASFRAADAGTVVYTGFLGGYGNTVVVEHSNGDRSLYAHAANILVHQGEKVKSEQVIGTIGSTGRSTGPHLHFELQRNGQKVDPQNFLTF